MVEFFQLFLTILQVLDKAVLEMKTRKTCQNVMQERQQHHDGLLDECVRRFHLVLQGSHALLQMELQPLVGFGEQTIDGVRQALVVLFVHLLSLTSLTSKEGEALVTYSDTIRWVSL